MEVNSDNNCLNYKRLIFAVLYLIGLVFPCFSFAGFSEADLVRLESQLEEFHRNCSYDLESNHLEANKSECDANAVKLDIELNKMRFEIWGNIDTSNLTADYGCPLPKGKDILVIRAFQLLNSNRAKMVKEWSLKNKNNLNTVDHKTNESSNLECNENEVDVDVEMIHSQRNKLTDLESKFDTKYHKDNKSELGRRIQKAKLKLEAIQYLNKLLGKRKCVDNDLFNDFIASVIKFHGGPVSLTYDDLYTLNKVIHDNHKDWKEDAESAPGVDMGWIVRDLEIHGHEGQTFFVHVEFHESGRMRISFRKDVKGDKEVLTSFSEKLLGEGADMKVMSVISKGKSGLKLRAESRVKDISPQIDLAMKKNQPTHEERTTAVMNHYANILETIEKEAKDKSGIIRTEIFERADGKEAMEQSAYDGDLAHLQNLDRSEVLEIYHQIAIGLRNLHAMKIVHRDFKEANVLVRGYGKKDSPRKRKAVVTDWGYALVLNQDNSQEGKMLKPLGTPRTFAPELWDQVEGKSLEERQKRILKRDVYAFGLGLAHRLDRKVFKKNKNGKELEFEYIPLELCIHYNKYRIGSSEFVKCYKEMAHTVYQESLKEYQDKYHGKPPKESFEKIIIDCLNPSVDERPTMDDVVTRFEVLERQEKFERFFQEQQEEFMYH